MKRMLHLLPLILFAPLGGCHHETPQQHEQSDLRAIAKVKAAQRSIPAPMPLDPQPVSFADLDSPAIGVFIPPAVGKPRAHDGCGFVPAGGSAAAPLFVAVPKLGLMKRDDRLVTFASDSGSPTNAAGLHQKYSSDAFAVDFSQGEAISGGGGWKAAMTVHDRYARIVYFSAGELRCRA